MKVFEELKVRLRKDEMINNPFVPLTNCLDSLTIKVHTYYRYHNNLDEDESTYSLLSEDNSIHDPLRPKSNAIGAHHSTTSALIRSRINKITTPPRLSHFLDTMCLILFVIMIAMFGIVGGLLGGTGYRLISSSDMSGLQTPFTVSMM